MPKFCSAGVSLAVVAHLPAPPRADPPTAESKMPLGKAAAKAKISRTRVIGKAKAPQTAGGYGQTFRLAGSN